MILTRSWADRSADDEAIRSAYRKRAKETHPDKGGDSEAFASVKRAHLVLSDAGKRAKFDATGECDVGNPDVVDQGAMNLITSLIQQAIAAEPDPTKVDLIDRMRDVFRRDIDTVEKKIAAARALIAKTEKMRGRFKRKKKRGQPAAPNFLERTIEWQIGEMKKPILGVENDLRVRNRALEMLAEYTFDYDKPAPMQQFVFVTASTAT